MLPLSTAQNTFKAVRAWLSLPGLSFHALPGCKTGRFTFNCHNAGENSTNSTQQRAKVAEQEASDDEHEDNNTTGLPLALTADEEEQAQAVLAKYNWDSDHLDVLTNQLSGEVEALEAIDSALAALSQVESALEQYDNIAKPMRRTASFVAEQEQRVRVQATNTAKLKASLQNVLDLVTFPPEHLQVIRQCDFRSDPSRERCHAAISALESHLAVPIEPAWRHMKIVQQQAREYMQAQDTFAIRLSQHLEALLEKQASRAEAATDQSVTAHVNFHAQRQKELLAYRDLLLWLKAHEATGDLSRFDSLARSYSSSIYAVYEQQLQMHAETTRQMMARGKAKGEEDRSVRRQNFAETFGKLVGAFVERINEEDALCQHIFDLQPVESGSSMDVRATPEPSGRAAEPDGALPAASKASDDGTDQEQQQHIALRDVVKESSDGNEQQMASLTARLTLDEILLTIFASVENILKRVIDEGCQLDSFHSMTMTLDLDQYVHSASASGFLKRILGRCLVFAKRHFNNFVAEHVKSMGEARLKRKEAVGILPFIVQFEQLVFDLEAVAKNYPNRNILDKAYETWLQGIFDAIYACSEEARQPDVLLFENLHHMYDLMSRVKIGVLKDFRRKAQDRYREHLQAYVKSILGRPMEHLSAFFEGVERQLQSGTSVAEVGYQYDFNKQKLREVIKLYPAKEVKRGLEATFKRVEKHLSSEEGLLDVVWRSMQEEFMRQYQRFDQLIEQCYKNANVSLEFSNGDVLRFFTEIAQNVN
ncbi:uncharacterized protein MONBRDRAFT_32259 [Monosiga brevicollis MX1]|uniref:Exocyst complex component Sec3 C-terminal domain-containing protein n=1 Tax=Monosiga brevicollis TaxID=81824 RepID=A9UYE4_MONBE|nr:uncharacterized protein MONBRDRAFT_32259 [Monosiga brevicollis MX1]EDQ89448.1 predicted protein [Monosiga brevicollis MX1]|eukprot:XP_001745477.1 hypothetical protein [Monosiga brevicollis MX1]